MAKDRVFELNECVCGKCKAPANTGVLRNDIFQVKLMFYCHKCLIASMVNDGDVK